jgi:hypothetical protein
MINHSLKEHLEERRLTSELYSNVQLDEENKVATFPLVLSMVLVLLKMMLMQMLPLKYTYLS